MFSTFFVVFVVLKICLEALKQGFSTVFVCVCDFAAAYCDLGRKKKCIICIKIHWVY